MTRLLLALVLSLAVACGSNTTTPAGPGGAYLPSFVPDAGVSQANNTLFLASTDYRAGLDAGSAWIAASATGIGLFAASGDLRFDATVLTYAGYAKGDAWQTGCPSCVWSVDGSPGIVSLSVVRPLSSPGATGTNVVVYLRFTAAKRGATALTWQAPQLLGASYIARFLAGAYGGTVTVR
jgi:hypothetical protein